MNGADLEQFRKRTRWVYYREGVAYGPFSVDEIFGLIDETVLNSNTELMELGANQRIRLNKVQWFAEKAAEFDDKRTREMDEQEFETARQRMGRARGVRFYAVNIALPLILILAVTTGIFWKQIFKASVGDDAGQIHVATEVDKEGDEGASVDEGDEKAKASAPVFVEADSPLEAGLEDYALGLTMEEAEPVASLEHVPLTARAKKLPKIVTVKRPSRAAAKKKKSGPAKAAARGPAAEGSGITEMDFSDDAGDDGGGDDVEDMVRRRLKPVLRRCAAKGSIELGMLPDIQAQVKVRPTGSLGSLRLTVEPSSGFSEIRMCIVAGMAGIRVPPFEGPALLVSTTN